MKKIYRTVNCLQILKYFVSNEIAEKTENYYDEINLTIEIFAFDDKHRRDIQDSINHIFRSTKNLYVTLVSNNSWHHSPQRALIGIIPNDTIVALEVFFTVDDLKELDFGSFKNLKLLSLRNFPLGSQILHLLNLTRVCPKLEQIILSSDKVECANHNEPTANFLEKFLRGSISLITEHHNIKKFTIEGMAVISNYIHMEPYKSYYEKIHILLKQNRQDIAFQKCSVEELKKYYTKLQDTIKERNEIEHSLQLYPDNIRLQKLHNKCQKEKEQVEADFKKLINFLIDHEVTDAQYYLAEFIDSNDPKKIYELLSTIPSSSSFFSMSNYKMAHLLLDFKNYQKIFPQFGSIDVKRKIISHLLLSKEVDKSLIANMLHEYVYGSGLLGENNIFMQIPCIDQSQPILQTSTLQTLFMLDLFRQSESVKKFIPLKKSNSSPNFFKSKPALK